MGWGSKPTHVSLHPPPPVKAPQEGTPCRDYDRWPWAKFNSVERQLAEHPSFVIGEFLFIALAVLFFMTWQGGLYGGGGDLGGPSDSGGDPGWGGPDSGGGPVGGDLDDEIPF